MFLISDVLISEDLYEEKFICDVESCKGACCWEGDYGAPLEIEEVQFIHNNLGKLMPYLSKEGKKEIEANGFHKFYEGLNEFGTRLLDNKYCVFLKIENGVGKCSIEEAYENDEIVLKKPISCHLYP